MPCLPNDMYSQKVLGGVKLLIRDEHKKGRNSEAEFLVNGSAHKSPLVFHVIEDGIDGVVTNGTQGFCNGIHVELSVHN